MTSALWWVHDVRVRPAAGSSGTSRQFGDEQTVQAWVEDGSSSVVDREGRERQATGRVFTALEHADLFTPGSQVWTPGSTRPATVIVCQRFDSGSLALGVDHLEVALS